MSGVVALPLPAAFDARADRVHSFEAHRVLRGLSRRARRVYAVLERRDGETLTYARIAREAGVSRSTARRALDEIITAGLVVPIKMTGPGRGFIGRVFGLTADVSNRDGYAPSPERHEVSTRHEQARLEREHPALSEHPDIQGRTSLDVLLRGGSNELTKPALPLRGAQAVREDSATKPERSSATLGFDHVSRRYKPVRW